MKEQLDHAATTCSTERLWPVVWGNRWLALALSRSFVIRRFESKEDPSRMVLCRATRYGLAMTVAKRWSIAGYVERNKQWFAVKAPASSYQVAV